MSEYQATLVGDSSQPDSEGERDTSGPTSQTQSSSGRSAEDATIVSVDCDEEIETWKESVRGAPHATFAIQGKVKQTLSGAIHSLGYDITIESPCQSGHSRIGFRASQPFLTCLKQALSLISIPYIEPTDDDTAVGRAIPKSNIEIFTPEPAFTALSLTQETANELTQRFHEINELEATAAQRERYRRKQQLKSLCERKGVLNQHLSEIKQTIRARLKFPAKYGSGRTVKLPHKKLHTVPEAAPGFEGWSLEELHRNLEATRENIAMAQKELSELQQQVNEETTNRYEHLVTEHFPEYTDELLAEA